jgi:hypothetical protein
MRRKKQNKRTHMVEKIYKMDMVFSSVVDSKRDVRKLLKNDGYKQLTINAFMKNDIVVILKSMVKDTNPRELDFLSITRKLFEQIKYKHIIIEVFERETFSSISHKRYQKRVMFISPTYEIRNRKNSCQRFLINENLHMNNYIPSGYEFKSVS